LDCGDVVRVFINSNHPMHLHGQDAYFLGWGTGVYNETTSWLNLKDPIKTDTSSMAYSGTWIHCNLLLIIQALGSFIVFVLLLFLVTINLLIFILAY